MKRTLFGAKFWDRFVSTHWGRTPVVFSGLARQAVPDAASLFERVVAAARRERRGATRPRLRFYGDGRNLQIREDFEGLLPGPDDLSLTGYADRVTASLKSTEWGVVLNSVHCEGGQAWALARELVHPLFERVGLPGGHTSIEAFVGPYASTPFAIHKDEFHVFTLPVVGTKRVELWPFEAVATLLPSPPSRDLDVVNTPWRSQLPTAVRPTVLEAQVGDLMYWPPDHWHIARGTGALSGTIAIAVGARARAAGVLGRFASTDEVLPAHRRPRQYVATVQRAAKRLQKRLASADFAARIEAEALRRSSALAFEPPVEPAPLEALEPDDQVEVDRRFPLLVTARGAELLCFANGHVVTATPASPMKRLIARLNTGTKQRVGTLEAIATRAFSREGFDDAAPFVRQFLATCVSVRALTLHRRKPTPQQ